MKQNPFYTSSNFWTFVVLTIGALFVGFPEGAAKETVSAVFALIAAGKGLQEWIKNRPAFKPATAINQSNFWGYLATAVTAAVPIIPLEAFDYLQDAIAAAIGGNWQGIFTALIGLATIVYNLVKPKKG